MSDIIGNPAMLERLRAWVAASMPTIAVDDAELLSLQESAEKVAAVFGNVPLYRRRTADVRPAEFVSEIPNSQRISQLFAWVARTGDGNEGIIGATLPGMGSMALITTKPEVALMMESHALDVQRRSLETDQPIAAVLRRFVLASEG